MKLTEELKQQICDLIEESLNNAKLQGLKVEDEGGGFPLVDYLSYEGRTILKGKEEITNIVEQIYFDMDSWDIELQQYAVSKPLPTRTITTKCNKCKSFEEHYLTCTECGNVC